jgi:SAM-dependent methyltransferase
MKSLEKVSLYWEGSLQKQHADFDLIPGEQVFFNKLVQAAKRGEHILEVGIGNGRMVSLLRKQSVKSKFYGIDIGNSLKVADIEMIIGDCRSLPFKDSSFDLVYSLGVVEHFPETELAIRNHAAAVKPGGYVFVTTPALSIFTPFRYLVYLFKYKNKGSFEDILGRNIPLGIMKKYFNKVGLKIQDCGYFGAFGIKRILRNIKIQNFLLAKFQHIFGAFIFIIAKKE